jgi:lysophospholipase L1-like esterase
VPRRLTTLVAALVAAAALLTGPSAAGAQADTCVPHWVGSWAASPSDGGSSRTQLKDQTLRMIVSPHLAGSQVRIRLDNRFGKTQSTVGPVTVALQDTGASIRAQTLRQVTFNGAPKVTMSAGGSVTSDAVDLEVKPFEQVAISVAVTGTISDPTEHLITRQRSFLSGVGSGDLTGQTGAAGFGPSATGDHSAGWYLLSGLDVLASGRTGAVVAFGDSITDGFQGKRTPLFEDFGTLDSDTRYPDLLQRRLDAAGVPLSVLNAGISSNRLLADGPAPQAGTSALGRFGVDALSRPGVTDVIVLEGINDIGIGVASAAQIIGALQQLVADAHAAGVRIRLGTLTPAGGTTLPTYGDLLGDPPRQQVNAWIRSQRVADGVVDFDAAVRDPSAPTRLAPAYNGSDYLHLSPAGHQALADAVDLSTLAAPAPCSDPALRVKLTPASVVSGRRTRVTVRVTTTIQGATRGVADVGLKLGAPRAQTDASGRARLTLKLGRRGLRTITAKKPGFTAGTARLRVR